jgi:hypothetical protein
MTIKIFSPDDSPEELAELCRQIQEMAGLFNTSPEAKKLLLDAQAGRISEQQLLAELTKL